MADNDTADDFAATTLDRSVFDLDDVGGEAAKEVAPGGRSASVAVEPPRDVVGPPRVSSAGERAPLPRVAPPASSDISLMVALAVVVVLAVALVLFMLSLVLAT